MVMALSNVAMTYTQELFSLSSVLSVISVFQL